MVLERGRTDQEIEIGHPVALPSLRSPELTEVPAGFLIDAQDYDAGKKFLQHGLAACLIARGLNAFPQLGDRNHADGQSSITELQKAPRNALDSVEMINDPVGVNEERTGGHSRGSRRVASRRLS